MLKIEDGYYVDYGLDGEVIKSCAYQDWFQDYKKYGYSTETQFVRAFMENKLGIPEIINFYVGYENYLIEREKERKNEEIRKTKVMPTDTPEQRKKAGYKKLLTYQKTDKMRALKRKLKNRYKDIYEIDSFGQIHKQDANYITAELNELLETKTLIVWEYINKAHPATLKELKDKLIISYEDMAKVISNIDIKKEFETVQEIYDTLEKINLKAIFNLSTIQWIRCPFIDGNKAILNIDENGVHKVFSFNPESEKGIVFNLINILSLYDISVFKIAELKNIEILESKIRLQGEVTKYEELLSKIKQEEFLCKYPNLHGYLKNYWWFLEELLNIGLERIKRITFLKKNYKLTFYYSTKEISSYLQSNNKRTMNYSKVAKVINIFCILGFFSKEFSPDFKFHGKEKKAKDINYLKAEYVDWEYADEKARILYENKINSKTITKALIGDIFGDYFAERIFVPLRIEKANNNTDINDIDDDSLPF